MLKPLLFLLLVGSSYLPLRAQTAPAAATTAPVAAISAGRQDTARALGSMFARHRKGGRVWLYIAGAGTLVFVRAATATPTSSSPYVTPSKPDPAGLAVVFGVVAGLPAGIGVSKLVRFSEAKEAALEQEYRSGKRLPRGMARRLKAKDF